MTKGQAIFLARDAFSTLELEPTRDRKKIQQAFKRGARVWHPDKHPQAKKDECEARFKPLVAARDTCLEVSAVDWLMDELVSSPCSAGSGSPPYNHPPEPRSAAAPSASRQAVLQEEWRIFVHYPSAYFSLFRLSTHTVAVTALVGLFSGVVTTVAVIAAVIASLVLLAVVLAVTVFALSIPVLGWAALFFGGLYAAVALLGAGAEGFGSVHEFVARSLSKTAYPRKSLTFTWVSSNVVPIVLVIPVLDVWIVALLVPHLIVTNMLFGLLHLTVSETLSRVEREYEAVRNRQSETALVVRSRERFGGPYRS